MTELNKEFLRKFLHFTLVFIPLAYHIFGKWQTLIVLTPISLTIILLDFLRQSKPKLNSIFNKIFGLILRSHEKDGTKLSGASWVALGACINFAIFTKPIAVTGFVILVISDALAAMVGKSFPSRPFFEKSAAGAIAFGISALAILFSCGIYFDQKLWFYLFGLFAVFCVTVIESRPSLLKIDDNFTIPIVFAVVMSFFDIMWNTGY